MSHVCASATEIPDAQLDTLIEAAKQFGLVFHKDQTSYKWFGKWMNDYSADDAAYKNGIKPEDYGKCVHAFSLPGCSYEIGVYRHPETGNLRLIYDYFGPGSQLLAKIGKQCEKLWNAQGEVWANAYAKKNKLKVKKRITDKGVVEMVFTK